MGLGIFWSINSSFSTGQDSRAKALLLPSIKGKCYPRHPSSLFPTCDASPKLPPATFLLPFSLYNFLFFSVVWFKIRSRFPVLVACCNCMTSASEFFHTRRLRFGRNSDAIGLGLDLDPPPSVDRSSRRHRLYHNSGSNQVRRDRVCDPSRRAPQHSGQFGLRRNSQLSQERESTRPEGGNHLIPSGNDIHSEIHTNAQDSQGNNGNDRLPGAVVLARERLLQRLRGVTPSSSRQSNRQSSGNHQNDIPLEDDFRLVNEAGDWEIETSREWASGSAITPLTNSIRQQFSKRPPGLTQEAINCLPVEIFNFPKESDAPGLSRASSDCSICLESFSEGDELTRLPCGHRYHFCCLDPWVRTCGDCPYCRRSIDVSVVTTEKPESQSS